MSLFLAKIKYLFFRFFLKKSVKGAQDFDRVPVYHKDNKRKEISAIDKRKKDFIKLLENENRSRPILADIVDKTSSRR